MKALLNSVAIFLLAISVDSDAAKSNVAPFELAGLPFQTKNHIELHFNPIKGNKEPFKTSVDSLAGSWFSKMLFALKEPDLMNYNGNNEIYRFTWLRTFHHPIAVRLEKQGKNIVVFTKVCDGAGGYEPGKLIQSTKRSVKHEAYKKLLDKLRNFDFWNERSEKSSSIGTDGSEWIIEAVKNNKYRKISRWTPTEGVKQPFREIGEYLVSISTVKAAEKMDYY